MLPAMRQARIIELLRRQNMATLKEMSDRLNVSVSTLRRDVDYLSEMGHVQRTHGGAILNEGPIVGLELERAIATEVESDAKAVIGHHAAGMIRAGQTVLFDSGTTTTAVARAARDRGIGFTAITNDVVIAAILSEQPAIKVLIAGGVVRSQSSTIIGADTQTFLQRLRVDLAFIGAHAISETELSDSSLEIADLKRTIMSIADEVVLLVDSSKFFSRAFCRFATFADLSRVITDDRLSERDRKIIENTGIAVDLVAMDGMSHD